MWSFIAFAGGRPDEGPAMIAVWILLGVLLSGPLWVLAAMWHSRRVWRNARRLNARVKGQEQLVELGQLAGGLAHEIKNPLSTINLNLNLLAEDIAGYGDEAHRRCQRRLISVQEEATRLRDILEDFLRFAGKYELQLATVDLRRLVGELADFFAPQAEAARIVMRTTLPPGPVRSRVDENLIKQALLNLMINATQAMAEGGELIIRLAEQKGRAIIEVIDTGPGIDPADLERIFQVYYSTKKHGSGLGLPTTRRIVREHEGTIHVQSERGMGTRFVISLPIAREQVASSQWLGVAGGGLRVEPLAVSHTAAGRCVVASTNPRPNAESPGKTLPIIPAECFNMHRVLAAREIQQNSIETSQVCQAERTWPPATCAARIPGSSARSKWTGLHSAAHAQRNGPSSDRPSRCRRFAEMANRQSCSLFERPRSSPPSRLRGACDSGAGWPSPTKVFVSWPFRAH